MILIPAIDLKGGQCVRLKQGLMDEATVFSDDPGNMALHWLQEGARRLHLVDLDGAFAGKPENLEAIKSILSKVADKIPVELGGGIRNMEIAEKYIDLGLEYIIIGTAAVKNPEFVKEAGRKWPGRVIVGLDAKDGMVATEGWGDVSDMSSVEVAKRFEDAGVAEIIYTDIGRDGMMSGINFESTTHLAKSVGIPVIASGGLTNLDDIRSLASHKNDNIKGAITGRAIYEGSINFKEAQELLDKLAGV